MAGIGFELKKLLDKDTYTSQVYAYFLSGLFSSGPWLLSIFGILAISLIHLSKTSQMLDMQNFKILVIYLIALTLITSSIFQLVFSRFVADQLYKKSIETIVPNLHGVLFLLTLSSLFFSVIFLALAFDKQKLFFLYLTNACFMVLAYIWLTTTLLASLKAYKVALYSYALGYSLVFIAAFFLKQVGLMGLLMAFFIGQCLLFSTMMYYIYKSYPCKKLIAYDFLSHKKMHTTLIFIGIFSNVGLWIDKFIFWFHPQTGERVFAHLHASILYDLPVFWAYLSIIPAAAVFLLKMEVDFSNYYKGFYEKIVQGGNLNDIRIERNKMIGAARETIISVIKTQSLMTLVLYCILPIIFKHLGISPLYLNLSYILILAAGLNIIFWALMNLFDYFDKLNRALFLSFLFVSLNGFLTLASIHCGVFFYGYGLACSLLICTSCALYFLNKDLKEIEFVTFMYQKNEVEIG